MAGAAALVWAANPSLSARQVADILKQTASGAGQWNPELGFGVMNVAAAVELARITPAVSLRASKYRDSVQLSWRGSTRRERAYRLLGIGPNGQESVLVPSTIQASQTLTGTAGGTQTFVVESLDADGAVIARSAQVTVTFGQAKSTLTLSPFRFKSGGKRYSVVIAMLNERARREARTQDDPPRATAARSLAVRLVPVDRRRGARDLARAEGALHDPGELQGVVRARVSEQPA